MHFSTCRSLFLFLTQFGACTTGNFFPVSCGFGQLFTEGVLCGKLHFLRVFTWTAASHISFKGTSHKLIN